MAETGNQNVSEPPPRPPPSRKARLRHLVRAAAIASVFGFVALAIVLAVAYRMRTRLTNALVKDVIRPLAVEAGSVEFDGMEAIVFRDVVVRDPAGGEVILDVPEVRAEVRASELRARRVDEIHVRGGRLRLGPEAIGSLAEPRTPTAPEDGEAAAAGLREVVPGRLLVAIGRVEIEGLTVEVALPDVPLVQARIDYEGEGVEILAGGTVRTGEQHAQLGPVAVYAIPGTSTTPDLALGSLEARFTLDTEGEGLMVSLLELRSPSASITPEVASALAALTGPTDDPRGERAPLPFPVTVEELAVTDAAAVWSGFGGDGRPPAPGDVTVPDGGITAGLRGEGVTLSMGGDIAAGHVALESALRTDDGEISAALETEISTDGETVRVHRGHLAAPALTFDGSWLGALRGTAPAGDPSGAPGPASPERRTPVPRVRIDAFELEVSRFAATGLPRGLPDLAGGVKAALSDVVFDSGRFSSAELQTVEVQGFTAGPPQADGSPQIAFEELALAVRPDALIGSKRIERLELVSPRLALTREGVDGLLVGAGDEPGSATTGPEDAGSPPRTVALEDQPWHGVTFSTLEVRDGWLEAEALPAVGTPALKARFAATTEPGPDGEPLHRITAESVAVSNPEVSETPFGTVREISALLNPQTFWEQHVLEELVVRGANVTVGPAMRKLGSERPQPTQPTETPPATEAPDAPGVTGWSVGSLTVTESNALLEEIVPGFPPIPFALDTTLQNVPLGHGALLASSDPQRVEISNARLRSPFNQSHTVADLRTIFVEFTLGGLLEQRLDKVEIVSPTIFVGEHLFWYIDYFRDYDETETIAASAGTPSPPHALAALAPVAAFGAVASGGAATDKGEGWDITEVTAHNGLLLLAPKGHVVPDLPALPFSGTTRLENSQLAFSLDVQETPEARRERPLLELTVPEGDYPLNAFNLNWEVDLIGLRGVIAFNLPIERRENNLVQTLEARQVWFEQVNGDEVWLAVTYDKQGIYAKFGGETYGGYTEGEFNVYLDEEYSFDGYVTGTGIVLGPLTQILTPEYLRMTGSVNAEIIAQGNLESLDALTAHGRLTSLPGSGGKIDIITLGDLLENVPEDTPELQKDLTTIGIETLQHFEYDTASIEFEAFGREGFVKIDLHGPAGSREFEIVSHDYRYVPPPPAPPPTPNATAAPDAP